MTFNEDLLAPWLTITLYNEDINFENKSISHVFDVYPCLIQAVERIIQLLSKISRIWQIY